MNPLLFFILLLSWRQLSIYAKVVFRFSSLSPIYKVNDTRNGTVVQLTWLPVSLLCSAPYPTQWIYNVDDEPANVGFLNRKDWTQKIYKSVEDAKIEYIAWIKFESFNTTTHKDFKCVAVHDDRDALLVQLIPKENNTAHVVTQNQTNIFKATNSPVQRANCDFKLTFVYLDDSGYYARCTKGTAIGTTVNHLCVDSASYCANTFRNLKSLQNVCSEVIHIKRRQLPGKKWTYIGGPTLQPGIVVCSVGQERGAQEYFFTPNRINYGGILEKEQIHLSFAGIEPKDMISMAPSYFANIYYVGQNFTGKCTFPTYGFAFDPAFIVTINHTVALEERGYKINESRLTMDKTFNVRLTKAGSYEVACIGPIWNSVEWAVKSVTFTVKNPGGTTPPYFEKPVEFINFDEGDENEEIVCNAKGAPVPEVEWILGNINFHNIEVKGDTLNFLIVDEFIEGEYICKATNFYGEATKTIVVNVDKRPLLHLPTGEDEVSPGNSITANILGVSVVILTLLLFLGMIYYYSKIKKLNKIVTALTAEEILEFHEGKKKNAETVGNSAVYIESLRYNNIYEYPRNKFQVDTSQILGSGAFGIVYKGTVNTELGSIDAAFKTIKSEADKSYFKALLAELKILAHLGNHESIVNLIGAWTKNLQYGEVFVFVELCECSLLNFLRQNASGFLNFVKIGTTTRDGEFCPTHYVDGMKQFSTLNLIQWGKEIATGLEFIASRNIVHGDIAARNILLTLRNEAKICDFGLARQLIDYNYIKSEQCPLPWKWMAIESLRQMQFSSKSDVWALGVTLWEIFTLGDIPYPGLTWSADFVNNLEQGLRLPPPANAPNEIWALMVECWDQNTEGRPTFTEVKYCLENFRVRCDRRFDIL